MIVICEECGLSLEQEKAGRYYCVNCNRYTEFFAVESKDLKNKE
ncbi:MAG: hypothetical protein BAJALOKI1v1_1740001 [Promethearchaeota archaeon]|nr:MAG: hypothetical protein BAJALOKI1v1_1740001 [Candidatus Lokiarchaeota archaeon]